ncbi:MAG: hypothetical protein Q8O41_01090 [Candidatus Methanoperedens sp.]|nr:hypothetical protein [Candidatus Methanoperedens sp.]
MREMKNYEFIDILGEEVEEEYPRDKYIDDAKTDLLEFFNERKSETFYLKQIIIFFEKKYYHWITAKAVSELVEERQLKENRISFGKSRELRFIFHKRNRYYKRQSEQKAFLVKEYSEPNITSAVGEQADVLFSLALSKKGFTIEEEDVNEFKGKKWTKTNSNLDLILSNDNIEYGVEIKNKLEYIGKKELDIKLDICDYLSIRPLFIMRFAPKSYIDEIRNRGGFTLIFERRFILSGKKI